jgi:RNA polymerase-binding transcription factor DksA
MAKSKKPTPKAAKKTVAKSKPAAKVKKASPVKAKKAAPKKVAKKAAPAKKVVAKKPEVVKKDVAKKTAPPKKVEKVEKVVSKKEKAEKEVATVKVTPPAPKPAPPQLTIFPVPNQRPIAHKPAKASSTEDRTRYSDDELKEFDALINRKLDKAREEYKILKDTLNRNNDEGTDATSGGNTKVLEDGAETAEKENLSQLAARQQKYISNLENALIRIKNGTYGICSVTGKLIPKERLIAVPHTTQSIEAKMMQHD